MKSHPTWIIHGTDTNERTKKTWAEEGAKLLEAKSINGKIILKNALKKLAFEGLTSGYCEGGSHLAAGLLSNNLVDELIIFTSEPPFLSFLSYLLFRIRKIKYILIIYDLYPETLVNLKILNNKVS